MNQQLREEFYKDFNSGKESVQIDDLELRLDWVADYWLAKFDAHKKAEIQRLKNYCGAGDPTTVSSEYFQGFHEAIHVLSIPELAE